jgi:hypothetical protein
MMDQAPLFATSQQLALPGVDVPAHFWCAMCRSWLPSSAFYRRYQRNHGAGDRGGSGYCRACHVQEGRRR